MDYRLGQDHVYNFNFERTNIEDKIQEIFNSVIASSIVLSNNADNHQNFPLRSKLTNHGN